MKPNPNSGLLGQIQELLRYLQQSHPGVRAWAATA